MSHEPIPQVILAEIVAAVALARRSPGAVVELHVWCDPKGNVRAKTEYVRGASSQDLVAIDKGPTIGGT